MANVYALNLRTILQRRPPALQDAGDDLCQANRQRTRWIITSLASAKAIGYFPAYLFEEAKGFFYGTNGSLNISSDMSSRDKTGLKL